MSFASVLSLTDDLVCLGAREEGLGCFDKGVLCDILFKSALKEVLCAIFFNLPSGRCCVISFLIYPINLNLTLHTCIFAFAESAARGAREGRVC